MNNGHNVNGMSITEFTIDKDLSGGIRIKIGPTSAVLDPHSAVNAAVHILKLCGINVEFHNPGQTVVQPSKILRP